MIRVLLAVLLNFVTALQPNIRVQSNLILVARVPIFYNHSLPSRRSYDSDSAESSLESLRKSFDDAVNVSKFIVSAVCASNIRVAPLIFEKMESNAIMQAWSPFVLMLVPSSEPTPIVWVPLSLAIRLIEDQNNTNAQLINLENATQTQARNALASVSEFDVFISVNTEKRFHFSDADVLGYNSVVSSFLHELTHAMGMVSVVNETRGAALLGYPSIYDAALRYHTYDTPNRPLFESTEDVQKLTGNTIQGISLHIANTPVYNPPIFEPGSSLSHNRLNGLVTSPSTDGSRRYLLTEPERDVMRKLGWNCKIVGTETTSAFVSSGVVDAALLSRLSSIEPEPHECTSAVCDRSIIMAVVLLSFAVTVAVCAARYYGTENPTVCQRHPVVPVKYVLLASVAPVELAAPAYDDPGLFDVFSRAYKKVVQ
jgi:hypothetical protein